VLNVGPRATLALLRSAQTSTQLVKSGKNAATVKPHALLLSYILIARNPATLVTGIEGYRCVLLEGRLMLWSFQILECQRRHPWQSRGPKLPVVP